MDKDDPFVYMCEHEDNGVECDKPADFEIGMVDGEGVCSTFLCEAHCQPNPEQWGWDHNDGNYYEIRVKGVNAHLIEGER